MARRRQLPGRKRRTREHVIADLSINFVERAVLLCGYTVERRVKDYGIDLSIEAFDRRGEVEVGPIEIQVKATDGIAVSPDGQTVSHRVSTADLKHWLFVLSPVVFTIYDARADVAYWLDVQEYARAVDLDIVNAKTATLRIPVSNLWTEAAVRELRAKKNRRVEWMNRRLPDDD